MINGNVVNTGERDEAWPPAGKPVLVRGEHFRCMAYRDAEGTWRDYFHREELRGPVQVLDQAMA